MSFILNTSSISPPKDKKLQLTKLYYAPPYDKQFIIYSMVLKDSGLGMTSHPRLLLFDSKNKMMRYYSKVPDPLPQPNQQLPEGKQTIFIKKVKNFTFKSPKTTIGKAIVNWTDLNGQKKSWSLTFKNNYLMNDWIIVVNQAIKDGHLKAENRPKSTSRRVTKPNVEKYMTPFMMETGGASYLRSRDSSTSRSNAWGETSTDTRHNENWISQKILQKQKEVINIHKEIHEIQSKSSQIKSQIKNQNKKQNKKQIRSEIKSQIKNQIKVEIKTSSFPSPKVKESKLLIPEISKKIGVIDEVQDQSKLSKRQQAQLHSQSTKQFRIQKPPPIEIPQVDESQIQTLAQDRINEQYNEPSQNFDVKKFDPYQHPKWKHQQKLIPSPKQHRQCKWINQIKYYPEIYQKFIKKCEELSIVIIENLSAFLRQAEQKPSSNIHMQNGYLLIVNEQIEFRVKIGDFSSQTMNNYEFYESELKVRQYSNMIDYIKKMQETKSLGKYSQIIPIPCCIVAYKWHEVFCKSSIPYNFSPVQNSNQLDDYFLVPHALWYYFERQTTLILDFTNKFITIQTQPSQQAIRDLCKQLCKEQIQIGHIKDLFLYCSSQFAIIPNVKVILRLMQRIKSDSNYHIFKTLLSILWGFRLAMYIRNELIQKLYVISQTQLYESIDSYIKAIAIDRNTSIYNSIKKQISTELQRLKINDKNVEPDTHATFSTILFLLGLEISKQGKIHSIKFMPHVMALYAESISNEILKISEIIKLSEREKWNQEQRYEGYQEIKEILNQFQYNWMASEEKQSQINNPSAYTSNYNSNKPKNHPQSAKTKLNKKSAYSSMFKWLNQGKYLNTYYRIMHYISLYCPYRLNDEEDRYSRQLESIINESPPNYFSYLIGINCIKWISKQGINAHSSTVKMMQDQIIKCKQWSGAYSSSLLSYYELYAIYAEEIFDLQSAIEYARYALEVVIEIYGSGSAEAAQKWFLLANIMVEGELYEQALEAYSKSLQALKISEMTNAQKLQTTLANSRSFLLSWRVNTSQAYLTIRSKMIKVYLTIGDVKRCLDQCSLSLKVAQQLPQPNPHQQLQILSTIIRCYELTKQKNKLIQMVQIVATQFCNRIAQLDTKSSQQVINEEQSLRENVLKICLSPYISARITDQHRKQYLYKLVKAVRMKYETRYNKKQCNSYLTKITLTQICHTNNEKGISNIIEWFTQSITQLPVFNNRDRTGKLQILDINYSLHESSFSSKIQPATQCKLLITVMKAIQAISGILGYAYLQACFSD